MIRNKRQFTGLILFLLCTFVIQYAPCVLAGEDLIERAQGFVDKHADSETGLVPWQVRAKALKALEAKLDAGTLRGPDSPDLVYSWHSIGPAPLHGEYQDSAQYTGRVTAIATHPTDPSIVYLGTANGGVWKTTDIGETWLPKTDQEVSLAIGALAVAPSNSNIIYAGTGEPNLSCDSYYGAGVLKSTDAGETWINVSRDAFGFDPFDNVSSSAIVVHPTNPNIVWLATTNAYAGQLTCFQAGAQHQYGVWLSTDGGVNWSSGPIFDADSSITTDVISDLVLQPGSTTSSTATLFAGVMNGNASSNTAGVWRLRFTNLLGSPNLTQEKKFQFCNDNGSCPNCYDSCGSSHGNGRISLAVDPQQPTVFYAAAAVGSYSAFLSTGRGGIFRTDDAGDTWAKLNFPEPTNRCQAENQHEASCNYPADPGCCPSGEWCTGHHVCERYPVGDYYGNVCFFALPLAVDYQSRLWIGGLGVWHGQVISPTQVAWESDCWWGMHVDQHAIEFFDQGDVHGAWLGNDGGVMVKDLSQTGQIFWGKNGSTLAITQFYPGASLHIDAQGWLALAGTQDVGVLKYDTRADNDDEHPWRQEQLWCDGGGTVIEPFDSWMTRYESKQGNRIFKTVDDGINWDLIFDDGREFIGAYAMCPESSSSSTRVLIAEGGGKLRRTNDAGVSWDTPQNPNGIFSARITALAFGSQTSNSCDTYFVGLKDGEVYRTTDSGANWTLIYAPDAGISPVVLDLAQDHSNPDVLYIAFASGGDHRHLIKFTDALAPDPSNWQDIDAGYFEGNPVNAILVDSSSANIVYAGSDLGVFRSSNGGADWQWFMDGHPRTPVHDLVQDEGEIVSFTHGRSAFRLQIEGSLTVTRPNGTEVWQFGDVEDVLWQTQGIGGDVRVELSDNFGISWTCLFNPCETPNDGAEPWLVNGPITNHAIVRISSVANPGIQDLSDSYFSIVGLEVTAPTAGATWVAGSTETVEWIRQGLAGTIDIEISHNGGTTWDPLASDIANDGSEDLVVPGPVTTEALIRVISHQYSNVDAMTGIFTIIGNSTYTVRSNGDETDANPGDGICANLLGRCTLRAALQEANATPGTQWIHFSMRSVFARPPTISPNSALPVIIEPVVIDGTTQPVASKIEINGSNAGYNHGLVIDAGDSIVTGLVINRFERIGLFIRDIGSNVLQKNLIGTDHTGTVDLGNGAHGLVIRRSSGNTIGGETIGVGNVISGNAYTGIRIDGGSENNVVAGNFIGSNISGDGNLGNSGHGVVIYGSSKNAIGRRGNLGGYGGNTIAFNGGKGVTIVSGNNNSVVNNSIFGNSSLGVDLNNDGVTLNDTGDGDTGANNLQNFPIIDSVKKSGAYLAATLQTNPPIGEVSYIIQVFANETCDASGFGEGELMIGEKIVTVDRQGFAWIELELSPPAPNGSFVTATASKWMHTMPIKKPPYETSEFSECYEVSY